MSKNSTPPDTTPERNGRFIAVYIAAVLLVLISLFLIMALQEDKKTVITPAIETAPTTEIKVSNIAAYGPAESALGFASSLLSKGMIADKAPSSQAFLKRLSKDERKNTTLTKGEITCQTVDKDGSYALGFTQSNPLKDVVVAYRGERFLAIVRHDAPLEEAYLIHDCDSSEEAANNATTTTYTPLQFDEMFRRPLAASSSATSMGNAILLKHAASDSSVHQDDLTDVETLRPIEEISRRPKPGELCASDDGFTQAYKAPSGKQLSVATRLGDYVGVAEFKLRAGMNGAPDQTYIYRCD